MRNRTLCLGLVVVCSVIGCGGGSGNSAPPPPAGDQPFDFGELSGRAAISSPPVTTNSPSVVSTALKGSFTILKLRELNPSLKETRIAFAQADGNGSIIGSRAYDGSDFLALSTRTGNSSDTVPSFAATGKGVYEKLSAPGRFTYITSADGTSNVQLLNQFSAQPNIDLAGDKVQYLPLGGGLQVETLATKAIANIALSPHFFVAYLSPDGKTVYEIDNNAAVLNLYSAKADGTGSATLVAPMADIPRIAISNDSDLAAYPDNANSKIVILNLASKQTQDVPLNSFPVGGLSFSPDGTKIAFANAAGKISIVDIASDTQADLTGPLDNCSDPAWMPFVKDRTLISSGGGILGTHACGVIYSQNGKTMTNVIAFDATTPSSVVMTAQTTTNSTSPNLVFSIDADNIIKLAYANGYAWRGIRAIGSGTPVTSANGALVSIDSSDGTVVGLLPFTGTRAAGSKPTITDSGSLRTFSGHFLAVYDSKGNNIAPHGATRVRLDMKTKALTAF